MQQKPKFEFPKIKVSWEDLLNETKPPPKGVVLPKEGKYVHKSGHIYKLGDPSVGGLPPIYNPYTKLWNVQKRTSPHARNHENNPFVKMQKTEEGRRLWKLWTDKRFLKGQTAGRPRGAMVGYNLSQTKKRKARAKVEAKEIVALMEKKGYEIPKQEFAKESIETAVEIMRMTEISPKDKLTAARTVLEWTLAKPVAQSEVSIKKAEDFLAMVSIAEESAKNES